MNCSTGGFPTIWHNELRGFSASLLSEVCFNVSVEPNCSPLLERFFHLLQLMLKMVHIWMLQQVVFGGVTIRKFP